MEVGTVAAAEASTGSRTMADLALAAGEKFSDRPALRHKVGDAWVDITFADLADEVRRVAGGLIDVGIQPGDKVAILSNTRAEWTFACFGILAAGATCVSIYQTNSPQECHYVLKHSDSRAVFVEDGEQLEKIRAIEADLPSLELIIVMEPDGDIGDSISLDQLEKRGERRAGADVDERVAGVSLDDNCLYIYTSGTTGPPKACMLTHGNYRRVANMVETQNTMHQDELVYLFLPLAHAFALLIQFVSVDLGSTIAFWERDAQKIIPNLMEVRPTYFPSVPRIFEKIFTLARQRRGPRGDQAGGGGGPPGARAAGGRRGGPGEAAGGLRGRRPEAVPERAQPVRRAHPPVRDRRRADRQGDPRVLLRLRRSGDGGLRDDRDLHGGQRQPAGRVPLRLGRQAAARAWR